MLKPEHIARRLQYSIDFQNWGPNEWSRVIFIDEFALDTSEIPRTFVLRQKDTRFSAINIRPKQVTNRFRVSFIVGSVSWLNYLKRI